MAAGLTEAEAAERTALLDVESYAVLLDLSADPVVARSRTEIRFLCREPGAATFADLSVPVVSRVIFNGAPLDPGAVLSDGRLRLDGLAASNVLTVEADVSYSRDGRGLSRFVDPADGGVYVLGYCYPTQAPSVFCCFDQPDLCADITLEVSAPAGWECVSNGDVIDRPGEDQAGVWRFAAVVAMKPCELTLCAGPYATVAEAEHRGIGGPVRLRVRCRRALAGSADLARAAGVVRQALGYYERLLGVACPCDKYDVVFAPDVAPLAAQLPALMLVNESLLHRVAEAGDDFVTMVLAHEPAHLWFGCLVEGRWWDDLWLAEALATYLSYTALDEVEALGVDSPWAKFAMREKATAYLADSLPSTQPVSSPVDNAAEAMTRPSAITYNKGASVIRQLAALIGDDALRAGLREYLRAHSGATATLADLVACWSAASGRDLTGWADQWLRAPGANTLRPELTLTPDGVVLSLAVLQQPPPDQERASVAGALRTHRLAIGLYKREDNRLHRRRLVAAEVEGARTVVSELEGTPAPDAIIVNDGDLTFATIRFDDRSFRALVACAMDVGDPLAEAVCWNAVWDMTAAAELGVSQFTDLVVRRIASGNPPVGVAELLEHAVNGADYYAAPARRLELRERLATAALTGAERAQPGSRDQRAFAMGFAASAQSASQLDRMRSWLSVTSLPEGVTLDLELRGQILATLSARDLTNDDDLDAFAREDPVGGETQGATCRALRPYSAAKEVAWVAALAGREGPRMAQAHARGIWAPGQEDILVPWRDRYFSEALSAASDHEPRTAQRLGRLLYPATLADSATIAATDAALERGKLGDSLRIVLIEQRAILQQRLAARAADSADEGRPQPCDGFGEQTGIC